MLNKPSVADEAQLKADMRKMYAEIGFIGCQQVFYEMLVAANWMAEVMLEEKRGEQNGLSGLR